MFVLVSDKLEEIATLCAKYRVKRLDLFGSAVEGRFDPAHSDLDFLVEFLPLKPGQHADSYFGLLEDLERLFERGIDLVMVRAVRNRYFKERIEASRELLYAA